jgi:hypothetical protein
MNKDGPASSKPLSPDTYSEALEQQLALVRDLTGPRGPALCDGSSMVKTGEASATRYARFFATLVSRAQPFFWAAHLAHATQVASRTLPTYTFTAESFPCPDGFMWFQEPVELLVLDPGPQLLQSVYWHVGVEAQDERGVPVLLFGQTVDRRRRNGMPTIQSNVRLGQTLEDMHAEIAREGSAHAGGIEAFGSAHYLDISDAFHRFLAACLSFLEQRLVLPVTRPASRGTRRRLEREHAGYQHEPVVQVIELRRKDRPQMEREEPSAITAPDWRYQWVVSGHWRRQYYRRTDTHKPRYIAPYVKGPEDKPLKAPAGRVFAVTR